jgi:tetratricopeptide (TPR) repeat protein
MKKFIGFIFALMLAVTLNTNYVKAEENIISPYLTYALSADRQLVPTTDAYTPSSQIFEISGERFTTLEHVFIDDEQYIYITDSGIKSRLPTLDENGDPILNEVTGEPLTQLYLGKIYILDSNYNLITQLVDKKWNRVRSVYVTNGYIYVIDSINNDIYLYDRDKLLTDKDIVLVKTISKPAHPIFENEYENGELVSTGYSYRPEHLIADARGNIYIQGAGSKNGLMMLDSDGNFITFFGGNPLRIPLLDQIRTLFLNDDQKSKMQNLTGSTIYYDVPTNIAVDEKGYIYTVTASLKDRPVSKLNVSGRNFYSSSMYGAVGMNSVWIGNYENVFTVNSQGHIFEYDSSGNLLFLFGGRDYSSSRQGLLVDPVSIAVNSQDNILVADKGGKFIQIYQPTAFANAVHLALDSYYNHGNYTESVANWEAVLSYNQMFDYAHIGLGNAFMREKNYDQALYHYQFARYYQGISNASWSTRQIWLKNNLSTIFYAVSGLLITYLILFIFDRKFKFRQAFKNKFNDFIKKNRILDELLYMFTFVKHPFDGFYMIKREKRVSVVSSTIIYGLLIATFVAYHAFVNPIFTQKITVNIGYELFILVSIAILWIVSNYLVCSINDGEGSISDVYCAFAYILTPVLMIIPPLILFTQVLTLNEVVFYNLTIFGLTTWEGFLLFFMIKDIHNYSVSKTFGVIFKSLFTMVIFALLIYIISSLTNQIITIVSEIIMEVLNR